MLDELDYADDGDFAIEGIDFSRSTAHAMFRASLGSEELMARWDRIRSDVPFLDLAEGLLGQTLRWNERIWCPFYRNTSKAFELYRRTNDAYCFGCPEGKKHYDAVRLVQAIHGYTKEQSIRWIEKEFALPPLDENFDDEDEDETEEGKLVTLTFHDLKDPFITLASGDFLKEKDPDLAREYIELFFDSIPDRNADPTHEDQLKKCMPMARVLGSTALEALKKRKFGQ